MKSTGEELTIGELAARFGLATHVLRHWETVGLLHPRRAAGDRRRYTPADLVRIAVILISKDAGFTLPQIRELLTTDNPMDHPHLRRRHVAALEQRIERARAAKELIEHALSCPLPFDECPHARERIEARMRPSGGGPVVNPLEPIG
ncbi:MerR family transcriptional regulator [Pseudonocardia lacus]|uniref:MerR family transcriptional regulator n=1 Tax=Pseudonocardia lacus TaxID=2835865 RepID=UPI001BDC819E|nr:MerR family transcriptional regulator [Pseudonocardia lacus]